MSYQALYRKYRPKTFEEVIGQEHITTTLKNQILSGRVGHAYLFCGIRGTGKTSIAKIFAKAVNCTENTDGNPCLDCDVCADIASNVNINVIEIDAASNNGVDNVREIREEVKYMPTKGKYKVYIIDEVHMLSMSAFNALLKTLEEPPAHVIFILATTEVQKIPATILSRCQRFDLKRIPVKTIANQLDEIMKKEGIDVEEKALSYIAATGDGSMRDSLSLLDQIVAFSQDEKITLKMVLEVLGTVDNQAFVSLIKYIYASETSNCIRLINDIYMNGKDIKQFVSQMVGFLRNLIIALSVHELDDILDMAAENIEDLKQLAQIVNYEKVLEYINEFSNLEAKIKYDSQPKITLEVAIIRMSTLGNQVIRKPDDQSVIVTGNQEVMASGSQGVRKSESRDANAHKIDKKEKVNMASFNSNVNISDEMKQAIKMWKDIREICKEPLKSMLVDTESKYYNETCYCIVCPDFMIKNIIEKNIGVIKEKIEGMLKKEYNIKLLTKEEYEHESGSQKNNKSSNNGTEDDLRHVEEFFNKFGVEVERKD